jgi:hypothetical protein
MAAPVGEEYFDLLGSRLIVQVGLLVYPDPPAFRVRLLIACVPNVPFVVPAGR